MQGSPLLTKVAREFSKTWLPSPGIVSARPSRYLRGWNWAWLLELDGAGDLERQRRLGHERGRQPEPAHRLGLPLDLLALLGVLGDHVVVLALEVALDPAPRGEVGDPLDGGLVRVGVDARAVLAERVGQPAVDDAVARGDLGGRVAGRAADDPLGVEQRHALARALEQDCSGHPGDPRADHGDVDLDVCLQLRVVGVRRRGDPDRLAPLRHPRHPNYDRGS